MLENIPKNFEGVKLDIHNYSNISEADRLDEIAGAGPAHFFKFVNQN